MAHAPRPRRAFPTAVAMCVAQHQPAQRRPAVGCCLVDTLHTSRWREGARGCRLDALWSDARRMPARPNRPRSTPRVRRRVGATSVSNAQSAHRGQPGCSLFLNVRLWEREDRYRSRSMPRSNEQHCDDASATRASACNPPLSTAMQWTGEAPYVLP